MLYFDQDHNKGSVCFNCHRPRQEKNEELWFKLNPKKPQLGLQLVKLLILPFVIIYKDFAKSSV